MSNNDFIPGNFIQGDEVGGSNERCPLTSNFDAKNSRSEAVRAFDCHIFAPVKQLLNLLFKWA